MRLDPLSGVGQRRGRAQPALAHPAELPRFDQAGEFQDADVLLDPVEGQAGRPRELGQRRGAVAQALEDAPPRRVGEREERRVQG